MDILQFFISSVISLVASTLSYFLSLRKVDAKIETVKINSETEILKIKEEAQKEIDRIKAESNKEVDKIRIEHEEFRKTRRNDSKINAMEMEKSMTNEITQKWVDNLIKNPDSAMKQIEILEKLEKRFPNKNKKK